LPSWISDPPNEIPRTRKFLNHSSTRQLPSLTLTGESVIPRTTWRSCCPCSSGSPLELVKTPFQSLGPRNHGFLAAGAQLFADGSPSLARNYHHKRRSNEQVDPNEAKLQKSPSQVHLQHKRFPSSSPPSSLHLLAVCKSCGYYFVFSPYIPLAMAIDQPNITHTHIAHTPCATAPERCKSLNATSPKNPRPSWWVTMSQSR